MTNLNLTAVRDRKWWGGGGVMYRHKGVRMENNLFTSPLDIICRPTVKLSKLQNAHICDIKETSIDAGYSLFSAYKISLRRGEWIIESFIKFMLSVEIFIRRLL